MDRSAEGVNLNEILIGFQTGTRLAACLDIQALRHGNDLIEIHRADSKLIILDGLQHGSDLLRLSVQRQHICYMVWHTVFLLFHFHLKALYFLHRLFFRQLRCRKLAENIFFRDQGEGRPVIPMHLKLAHIVHMGHRASRS